MWLCICSERRFEDPFENTQWRKGKQMQSVRLWIISAKQFEETFENTLWKKLNKCYQCNHAIYQEGHLWRKVKPIQPVWIYLLVRWGHIWKYTQEIRQTNATDVILHSLDQAISGQIWKWVVNTFKRSTLIYLWYIRISFQINCQVSAEQVHPGPIYWRFISCFFGYAVQKQKQKNLLR